MIKIAVCNLIIQEHFHAPRIATQFTVGSQKKIIKYHSQIYTSLNWLVIL